MKAPDKIYVHVRTEPHPSITFSEVPEKNSTNEEYIRKDVLLEWTKKEMEKWSSESNTAQGVKIGLTLVMDKIESL